MDMDALIESEIGSRGLWQVLALVGGSFVTILGSIVTFLPSFTTYLPEKYRCLVPDCEPGSSSDYNASFAPNAIPDWGGKEESVAQSCNRYRYVSGSCDDPGSFSGPDVPCTEHVFDTSSYTNSFVMEYDLPPCLEAPNGWPLYPVVSEIQLLGLSFMVGLLIGAISTGMAADAFGRKKTVFGCLFLSSALVLGGYWANGLIVYVVLRMLCGIVTVALFTNCFVILVEMVPPKDRDFFGIILNIPFAMGQMVLSLMAYFLQDWRNLHMAVGVFGLACMSCWPLLPESARWLLSVGRKKEAIAVLQRAAKMNGKVVSEEAYEALEEPAGAGKKKEGLRDLFKNKTVVKIALIMFYNWFSTVSVYYGLSLIAVNLGGDIYLNFFLSGLVEIPSYIFTVLLVGRIGRQFLFCFCSLTGGLACMAAGLLEDPNLTPILALGGKFFVSVCFAILFLYTAELFPTEIRNSVLGMASMWGRLGGIASPFIASVGSLLPELPFLIMGSFGVLGGLLGLALPETLGARLPERIDDINVLSKNVSPVRKFCCGAKKESFEDELMIEDVREENLTPDIPQIIVHAPTPMGRRNVLQTEIEEDDPKDATWAQDDDVIINKTLESSDYGTKDELAKGFDTNDDGGQPLISNEDISSQNNAQSPKDDQIMLNNGDSQTESSDEDVNSDSQKDPIVKPPSIDTQGSDLEAVNDMDSSSSLNPDDKKIHPSRRRKVSTSKPPPKVSIDSLSSILEEDQSQLPAGKATAGPSLVLPKGASRKFSQLNPAPLDSPDAKRIGNFVMIPTLRDAS